MKYPWLGLTIALLWFMATFTILVNTSTNPTTILLVALVATSILSFYGFRVPK